MPVVPEYGQPRVELQPGLNFRDNTRATGDMFGAQVGEALSSVGKGVTDVGQAIQAVNLMKSQASALSGVQQAIAAKDRLLLGDGETPGYSTLDGKAAIDAYPGFQKSWEEARTKIRASLDPAAQQEFDQRIMSVDNDALRQGLTVRASGEKSYIIGEHTSAADTFKNQAIQYPSDEGRFRGYIASGLNEIDQLGAKQGWGPKRIENEKASYVSSARVKSAEFLAQSDPLAALKYVAANTGSGEILPGDAATILDKLKPEATAAIKRDAAVASIATPAPNQFAAGGLPPQAYPLLGAIGHTESPGYNVINGGARFRDFSQHPGTVGPGGSSTAAGRYQFVKGTWQRVSGALGLQDFSPASQDIGAWWLAQTDYRARTGRSLGADINDGQWAKIRAGLAPTWEGIAKLSDAKFGQMMEARMNGVTDIAPGDAVQPTAMPNGMLQAGAPAQYGVPVSPAFRLSPETETILSSLPPAYADQLRTSALAVSVQDQAAAAKLEKDAREALADRYRNRLAIGDKTLTVDEIQGDPTLDQGQKATLTDSLNAKNKDGLEKQRASAAGDYTAAAEILKNQAIDVSGDEQKFTDTVKQGLSQIERAGREQNWGANMVAEKQAAYVSDARSKAALNLSLSDPIAALKYATDHAGDITPDDRKKLFDGLKSGAVEAIKQQISPVDGQPETKLSAETEAILNGLPGAYANDLRKVAHLGVLEDQQKSAAALKAARETQADRYRLRIATNDDTLTPEDIKEDPMLDDGQRAALINTWNEKNKQVVETRQNVADFAAGRLALDGYTEAGRKANDAVWESASTAAPPEQRMPLLSSLIKQTDIVPTQVVNGIRRGLDSRNPSTVVDALQLAQQVVTISPTAFKGDGAKTVEDAAIDFTHMVNDLGYSPQEAAQHYLRVTDPANEKIVDPAATEKLLKNVNTSTLANLFDTATTWQPNSGFDTAQGARMVADYKDLLKREYEETADPTIAQGRANARFTRLYGRTDVTGSGTVMKYPPENYYPAVAGSRSYLKDQLLRDVNSSINGAIPDPMIVGSPAGLVEKGNIDLLSRPQVKNADGSVSTVLSTSFEEDGKEVLVPKVSPSGVVLTDEGAMALYRATGKHLGKFDSPAAADAYAQSLHDQQAKFYTATKETITPDMIRIDPAPGTAQRIAAGLPPTYVVSIQRKDANGLPYLDMPQNGMAYAFDPKEAQKQFSEEQKKSQYRDYSLSREQQLSARGQPVALGSDASPVPTVSANDIPANRMVGAGRQAVAVPLTQSERQAQADKQNQAATEDRATVQRMLENAQAPLDTLNANRNEQAQQPAPMTVPAAPARPAAPLMGAQREKNLKGKK